MHALGWTTPGYFDSSQDAAALAHAIARYHAYVHPFSSPLSSCARSQSGFRRRFLDLMSAPTSTSFVPTLDIDLAWHTHQLAAGRYSEECMQYVGRFVDQWVLYHHEGVSLV